MPDLSWAAPPPEAYASGYSLAQALQSSGQQRLEALIEEAPLTLLFNETMTITLMATPLQAEALALGFCLSEGLVQRADEVQVHEALPTAAGLTVWLSLPPERLALLQGRRRLGAAPGGCGLCGLEDQRSLFDLPVAHRATPLLAPAALQLAQAQFAAALPLGSRTGGAHAAALFDFDGQLLQLAEDASRHCALDKAIGLQRQGFEQAWALVSSRASFELVAKAARVGLPLLAALSAPTALAQRAAEHSGVQLLAFVREGRWSQYTIPKP